MKTVIEKILLVIALNTALGLAQGANAALVKGDFQNLGDGLLITDAATNLEWLTPFFTRGHTYNDSFVQGLITSNGFRYATALETSDMISLNFNNPVTSFPGNAAGFLSAQNFLNTFGINQMVFCVGGPCPRTQGLTSSSSAAGNHLAFGMIQFGSNGWMIANNSWSDGVSDLQMGSWLVRPVSAVPAPPAFWLMLTGLGVLYSRFRLSKAA
jgi:hypothetical protein